jgi:uncharacterized protein (DUF885 family)
MILWRNQPEAMKTKTDRRLTMLTRRDFLHLLQAGAGIALFSPLLVGCEGDTLIATPTAGRLTSLEHLTVDEFFEQAFRLWLIRDPENLTSLGLADHYGVGDSNLTDISATYLLETQALEASLLASLRAYETSVMTPDQVLTRDVFEWFLDDLVRSHPFMYADYPLNPIITSVHYNLYMLFTAYHPLATVQDVQDYLSRLSQVENKIDLLIDGLEQRSENGVILPAFLFPMVRSDLQPLADSSARQHPFYTSLDERMAVKASENRQTTLAQAEQVIDASVKPAYQELVGYLEGLEQEAPQEVGVEHFPDGRAYYNQAIHHHATIDMTVEEIHELGVYHVSRLLDEMHLLFSSLGYPADGDLPSLFGALAHDGGVTQGDQTRQAYEEAITSAEEILPQAFDLLPRTDLVVQAGGQGDYYLSASFDGSRPGIFYARTDKFTPRYGIKSLAYHETVPGHHLQISIAQEQTNLPSIRQGMQFNAFTEGWALYAERLMWELGVYREDPAGDLGRLQMETFRAARLVVDTGIHSLGWDFSRAVDYLVEATGFPITEARREITRYSVWPGQAVSYYIGFLKILELRQKVMTDFGDGFDLKSFHRLMLVNGALPLPILERMVNEFLETAG